MARSDEHVYKIFHWDPSVLEGAMHDNESQEYCGHCSPLKYEHGQGRSQKHQNKH